MNNTKDGDLRLIQGNRDYLPFKRNCDGVTPVNFLKATLKAERVLNPLS